MANAPVEYIHEDFPAKEMNFIKRISGVIVSPGEVMENLAARPRVLFPLIMVAVAQLAFYMIRFPLYQDYLRKTLEASSQMMSSWMGFEMTPEIIEQSMSRSLLQSVITTPLTALFGWFMFGVIIFAIFKIFGAQGKFKQYLSVIGYAYVISALYFVITTAVSFVTGSLHIDVPLTSIANLFSGDLKGHFLYGMLKGVDVFKIWFYAVVAIGMTVVSGFKKRTAYGILAGVFIIGLLIASAGEAAVGSFL